MSKGTNDVTNHRQNVIRDEEIETDLWPTSILQAETTASGNSTSRRENRGRVRAFITLVSW